MTATGPMFDTPDVTARIGLLAPPSNAVMEVEFYRSLPRDITVHTSHIFRTSRTLNADAMAETAGNAVQTALTLVQTQPALVVYGHAASSFAGGVAGDAELARRIAEAVGAPALTTASAIVGCLRSVGARRIWYIAPYPPAVVETGASFLRAHDFELSAIAGMGIDQVADLKAVAPQDVYELALRTAERSDADALFICGTGVRTMGVVGPLERALNKPVITANLAALWSALDRLGHADRFSFGASRLLEWQATAGA